MTKATHENYSEQPEKETVPLRRSLPRACQMRRQKEYARVYSTGVRARGQHILVVAAPGDNPLMARMGLSVGRKFNKSAVIRNRARRVMREAFRLERANLPALNLILIPVARDHKFTTNAVAPELRRLVLKLAQRLEAAEKP